MLASGEALVLSHSSWCHDLLCTLANQESHGVETPCSKATIALCCLGLQILACEHSFERLLALKVLPESPTLWSLLFTHKGA